MEWIKIIQADQIDHLKLQITFNDGLNGVLDFSPVADGGVLRNLQDSVFFQKFEIVRNGRAIEWPGGIDFCADALHQDIFETKYANKSTLLSATNK